MGPGIHFADDGTLFDRDRVFEVENIAIWSDDFADLPRIQK
jgi:hypothetical protein